MASASVRYCRTHWTQTRSALAAAGENSSKRMFRKLQREAEPSRRCFARSHQRADPSTSETESNAGSSTCLLTRPMPAPTSRALRRSTAGKRSSSASRKVSEASTSSSLSSSPIIASSSVAPP
eukprot:886701-Prymnesium_polylepis.2